MIEIQVTVVFKTSLMNIQARSYIITKEKPNSSGFMWSMMPI